MLFTSVVAYGVLATSALSASVPNSIRSSTESADTLLGSLQEQAHRVFNDSQSSLQKRDCTIFTARVRKDWDVLSTAEKKSYITAVQCLFDAPAQTDPSWAPGAKRRYDDFVAVHINQTLTIHGTGNFLTWHRYYTWAYEQALRDECSYDGPLPYWNWFANGGDINKSPVFDGSETSMGGDGSYLQYNGTEPIAGLLIPPETGGGCIASGPFANLTANMGPVAPAMIGEAAVATPLGYNPRCLKRDLSTSATTTWFTYTNLYNLTLGAASGSVELFQNELQGRFGDLFLGIHATGHVGVGGDTADVFASVVDPTFFLHHAMIDHLYWIWQMLHLNQADTIAGTITLLNDPPSRDTLATDEIYLSDIIAPTVTVGDVLSTVDGPLCYYYE